ncbi:type VI secretion system baseplate subunit TssG [Thaumasiovibrio subtropicus]|uniref:type VI secretion system baseplate subunit TssG n=1 Tax=Thaumasiovibrio subtropicus TaxID=1891207 RepID=UPI000B355BAD|nr:type VI secretion system baseplate subunit TssG [Thaumasiovibrio subtropicus]
MNREKFIDTLVEKPMFSSMHLVESYLLQMEETLGTDTLPGNENMVIDVAQHLGFAINDMEAMFERADGKIRIDSNVIGLTGANGVMPQHYTELVLQRLKAKDRGLASFYNIFNHRLLSLYFRTWKKFQRPVALRQQAFGKESDFQRIVDALTGRQDNRHWAGFHLRSIRSREAMRAVFAMVAGTDVEIKELRGAWMSLKPNEQTSLGTKQNKQGQHAQLGKSATLGKRVWNVNAGVEVICHVTDPELVPSLMPGGARLEGLKKQAAAFMPPSLSVKWTVEAEQSDLPVVKLSPGQGMLGRGGILMPKKKRTGNRITISV